MWDLWVRDHVKSRWYALSLISGEPKQNTREKICVKTWFHFTKIHFNFVCKGITETCFGLTFGVQKNPVLAPILVISRITETLPKMLKLFDEASLWLTNLEEGRECVLAAGIFLLLLFGCFGGFRVVCWFFSFWLGGRCLVWFGLLRFGFFLGKNFLLSPGFKLTPWESTFGRFFSPNRWVLLAPEQCGNSFRNSGGLEREREKRSAQGKEREKFLKGLANLSNLLTNVVWVPSLQWNLKPGKFLVIWGSAMNILHSSS